MLLKVVAFACLAGFGLATFVPAMDSEEFIANMEGENEGMNLQGVYRHCGHSRQCFGVPVGCIKTENCQQLLSYGKEEHHRIPFDLFGVAPNATYRRNFWVGFGASNSGGMDNSSVVQCAHFANGRSELKNAYNALNHTYVPLSVHRSGLHPIGALYRNGYVHCAFQMDVVRNVSNQTFDYRTPYYLLLGSGWVNHTKEGYELKWHLQLPHVFNQTVLACGAHCKNETDTPLPVQPTPAIDPFFPVYPTEDDEDLEAEFGDAYTHCGKAKKCFGSPDGCLTNKTCTSLIKYGEARERRIPIELFGTAPNSTYANNFWIGFGASASGKMDQSAVVQCAHYSNGTNDIIGAYNALNHTYQSIPDPHQGITKRRHEFKNGFLRCYFHLDLVRNVSGMVFNLSTPYNLLVGNGWVNETSPNKYQLMWHIVLPVITPKVNMSCGNKCPASHFETEKDVSTTSAPTKTSTLTTSAFTTVKTSTTTKSTTTKSTTTKSTTTKATTATSTTTEPTTTESTTTMESSTQEPNDCNGDMKCYGRPAGCEMFNNCTHMLKVRDTGDGPLRVVLTGAPYEAADANNFWIGFGSSKSGKMDDTAVVQCAYFGNGTIDVVAAYNAPVHNYQPLEDRHLGISGINGEIKNGVVTCSFELDVVRNLNSEIFDLTQPYNLLLARGWINQTSNELMWHHEEWNSTEKIVMAKRAPADIYQQCDISRVCLGKPEGCVKSKSCEQIVSYGDSDNSDQIPVDIYGRNANFSDAFWVALGLSTTDKMAPAAVIMCATVNGSMSAQVITGFNTIVDGDFTFKPVPEDGVYGMSSYKADGFIGCSFRLSIKRIVENITFDLEKSYTPLLATGPMRADNTIPGYHGPDNRYDDFSAAVLACGNRCPPSPCTNATCFGVPAGCEQTGHCNSLLAWSAVPNQNNTQEGGVIQVGIYGQAPANVSMNAYWIGFGVSHGRDMEHTAVVQCVIRPDGNNTVIAAYNYDREENAGYTPLNDTRGIHKASLNSTDGAMSCTFQLDVIRRYPDDNATFDLREYTFLMLGSGPLANDSQTPTKHSVTPRISDFEYAMACEGTNCTTATTTTAMPTSPATTSQPTAINQFGFPQGCEKNENSCKVLAKFGTSATNNSRVTIVLEGKPNSGEENGFWVAFGVNEAQKMDNAMVLECVRWMDGNTAHQEVFTSSNILDHHNRRTSLNGVYVNGTSMDNGIMQCTFDVDVVRDAEGTGVTYDLNKPYYLLLAQGKTEPGTSNKQRHERTGRIFSAVAVVVNSTTGGDIPAGHENKSMKKAHACLMVIAWNLCAAMGIFFARHTKNMWPEHNYFGTKTWFNLHRGHNFLAVILALIAFIIIFVDKAQWLDIPHAYTGIITFALAFIQPIIATFRPHPGTPNRPIFNYVHWTIGYVALILAGVTMFLGLRLPALDVPNWVSYLIVGSYVWNALLQMILENYRYRHQERIRRESREHLVTENGQVVEKTVVEKTVTITNADEPLHPDDNVRKLIMGLIYLGLLGMTIAIVALIAAY